MLLLALLVLVFVAFIILHQKKRPVIYGSMGCPHTVSHRKNVGEHTFVDCTSQQCPDFVEGYPTTQYPDGSIIVGATTK